MSPTSQPPDVHVARIRGLELRFRTRPGVFSVKGLDDGTRLLLEHLDLAGAGLVADLGCGAGVLGIAAARLAPTVHVHLLDDHLRAVDVARENVRLNGVRNAEVFLSDLFSAVGGARYTHVLSNPPARLGNDFLEELIVASLAHLRPGGQLWLVVVSNLRPVFARLLARAGVSPEVVARGRQHVVIRAHRGRRSG
ncbi:MAG TPA: methyltransferase [Chloroflexota bacterium]|nr:methyltransferase [Chloroflexota bacterium]